MLVIKNCVYCTSQSITEIITSNIFHIKFYCKEKVQVRFLAKKNVANKVCFSTERIPKEQDRQNIRQDGSVGIIET